MQTNKKTEIKGYFTLKILNEEKNEILLKVKSIFTEKNYPDHFFKFTSTGNEIKIFVNGFTEKNDHFGLLYDLKNIPYEYREFKIMKNIPCNYEIQTQKKLDFIIDYIELRIKEDKVFTDLYSGPGYIQYKEFTNVVSSDAVLKAEKNNILKMISGENGTFQALHGSPIETIIKKENPKISSKVKYMNISKYEHHVELFKQINQPKMALVYLFRENKRNEAIVIDTKGYLLGVYPQCLDDPRNVMKENYENKENNNFDDLTQGYYLLNNIEVNGGWSGYEELEYDEFVSFDIEPVSLKMASLVFGKDETTIENEMRSSFTDEEQELIFKI